MPASYAHYRFGKLLLPGLPPDVRQSIQRFRRMYDVGLQGPDFFFYYNPLRSTAVGELGKTFHRQSGREFFTAACKAADSEAARVYLYGLLAHYCLDSLCHPFVNRLVEIGEAKHIPLESELDRVLLVQDGDPAPHCFDTSRFLRLTRGECMTAAAFFPGSTGSQVSHSFGLMGFFIRFLAHPNREKRRKLLQKIRPSLCDFMIPETASEDLLPYVSELQELYSQALERYPRLLLQITEHLQTAEPFGTDFDPTFG